VCWPRSPTSARRAAAIGAGRSVRGIAALAPGVDPPLVERAGPQLAALAAEPGETAMLAVPEGAVGARVVAEAAGPRMVAVGSWLRRTLTDPASGLVRMRLTALEPRARERAVAQLQLVAHTGSTIRSRRTLMVELDRIAKADYAEVVDELEQGLAGLAVPFERATGSSACWRSTFRPRGLTPRRAGARSERYGRRLSP
jgi:DNA-binding IclR family transcriptional regulator